MKDLNTFSKILVAPGCRSRLENEVEALRCSYCNRRFPYENDIATFAQWDSSHGELSSQEIVDLIEQMKNIGWQAAIQKNKTRLNRVIRLITDPRREISIAPILSPPGRVLDFGCGYGAISFALARHGNEVVSLDESRDRLMVLDEIRRQLGLDRLLPVWHRAAAQLPFADNSFDKIVLVGVFEYLPQALPALPTQEAHKNCLREFYRVLRPGGLIWILTKNRFGWQFLKGKPDHSGIRYATVMPQAVTNFVSLAFFQRPYRIINYSLPRYRKLLLGAGYQIERLFWPYTGYQAPDRLIPLNENSGRIDGNLLEEAGVTQNRLMRILSKLSMLHHVVPHVGILARKPFCD